MPQLPGEASCKDGGTLTKRRERCSYWPGCPRKCARKQSRTREAEENDDIDKSVAVVGGFGGLEADEAEKFVTQALDEMDGFVEAYANNPEPPVILARFASPLHVKKFLRRQKRVKKFRDSGMWASENRSPKERRRAKVLSKIKKFAIEIGGHEPRSVVINCTTFRANVRAGGRLHHVATVLEDGAPRVDRGRVCT